MHCGPGDHHFPFTPAPFTHGFPIPERGRGTDLTEAHVGRHDEEDEVQLWHCLEHRPGVGKRGWVRVSNAAIPLAGT